MQSPTGSVKIVPSPLGFALEAPAHVRTLTPYQAGKPIEETERELGISGVVKLASNENPLGPSPKALAALGSRLGELHRYPDGAHYALKQALSRKLSVDPALIAVGSGSNEFIDLLCRVFVAPGRNVVAPAYSFIAYKLCAKLQGCGYKEAPVGPDLSVNADAILSTVDEDTRLVFLANPGNPTGAYLPAKPLERLTAELARRGVLLVLDYAYWEYVTAPDLPDALDLLSRYPNVVVLRTFSKIYGLAALRVGYAVAQAEVTDLLNRARQPFNVSAPALWAAEAALTDTAYEEEARRTNEAGLAQLRKGLVGLPVKALPSQGNFILIDCGRRSGPALFDQFLRKGVITRPVKNYGLENHLRVSVGLPSENEKFLDAAQEILK